MYLSVIPMNLYESDCQVQLTGHVNNYDFDNYNYDFDTM